MTSKLRHAAPHKRTDPAIRVSNANGFRLPDISKRRPSNLRAKQNSALGARKHVPITLPTLSCDKD